MRPIFALYIFLIPCIALYLHIKRTGNKNLSIITKSICTGIILLAALLGITNEAGDISIYSILIITGLLMGLIGDVSIEFSFAAGMLFFGLGHLCYVSAILNISESILLSMVIFIVLCLLTYLFYQKSSLSLEKLLVPCIIYSLIILGMLSLAASIPFSIPIGGTVLFLGALLFTVSDALLVIINFGNLSKSSKTLDTVSLYSYFIGQSLFAVSIYYL